ncbi:MAG TPA: hypothetical protein VFT45_05950 [Longimicrobium sp.]|nr:hypothetical protein [Longimicrobium sp.]
MTTLATDRFNAAVTAMIGRLNTFLPPDGVPPRPASMTVLEASERPVGVGNVQGNVERGPLAVLGVRGGRVQARVRYDLRADTPHDAAAAVNLLQQKVRAARLDPLLPWIHDFLVLEPDGGVPAAPMGAGEGWRQSVEFRVLFEYRYEDPEEAGSLIVRIPVELRGEQHEDDTVTRELTRWDREAAPPLVLRGPRTVGRLTLLSFTGGIPSGQVVVRRTFDGAPPATPRGSMASFAASVLGPAGGRNEQVTLASVQSLLNAFAVAGADVMLARLGNPPNLPPQGVPAAFTPRTLDALRGVRLQTATDRLEIRYAAAKFPAGSNAVVYLGTARGPFV